MFRVLAVLNLNYLSKLAELEIKTKIHENTFWEKN